VGKETEDHARLRLNAICPYFTMFPLAFPLRVLRSAASDSWVLDPFCGRGTTNFAARILGLSSVGIDSSAVAHAIASAKLASSSALRVTTRCKEVLEGPEPRYIPPGLFWRRAFHPRTLQMICQLRESLIASTSQTDIILRALVLGILHGPRNMNLPTYLSSQMPRTYATKPAAAIRFWRKHRHRRRYVDVYAAIQRRAARVLADLPPRRPGAILLRDSRDLDDLAMRGMFDIIVTSPPYLGLRTYRPDQWLREWFVGGEPSVAYGVEEQIATGDEETLADELGAVWRATANVSKPRANLVVRFGTLASNDVSPYDVIRRSLQVADVGWKVVTVRSAGNPPKGRRQAEQFGAGIATRSEIDVYAVLDR
jgi:hypothetical protein